MPRLVIVLLVSWPALVFAWGQTGHSAVCEIAFAELEESTRAEVRRLIDLDPGYDTFAESCNWADEPPRQREFDHFINLPRNAKSIAVAGCPLAETCLFTAIQYDSAVLADAGSSDSDRLEALKLLGHWVGDMHQPMHVTFADDRGANSIEAIVEEGGEAVESNLHAAWDYWIISRRLGDDWRAIVRDLRGRITDAERELWRYDGPVEWANESFRIATSPATLYCTPRDDACWYDDNNMILNPGEPMRRLAIDDAYAARHIRTVELRITQAGLRLAALLDHLFERAQDE